LNDKETVLTAEGLAKLEHELDDLTARERQVLAEVAAGRSNGAIADSLFLTKRAVEKHINAIFLKLGLREYEDTSRRVTAALIYLADAGSQASLTESSERDRPR